jgi:WD40 repeat protein
MVQELAWLDSSHFVVGRWDGSMSVFDFQTSASQGPLMTTVVNSPAQEGVQMITPVAPLLFVSANDAQSLILWSSPTGAWDDVSAVQRLNYSSSYGVANSGAAFPSADGTRLYLVVGHETGYLSIWSGTPAGFDLTLLTAVNLSNSHPVNPWNLHNIRGVAYVSQDAGGSYVVTGSEDGNLTVVQIPSGKVMSAVVYNPQAQRGINSIAYSAQGLLVANCAVGPTDKNLWYYAINPTNWAITLIDSTNLVIDKSAAQVFNFDVIWGTSTSTGPCWFASTEEGYLWMGVVSSTAINVIGSQMVTSPLGAALGITPAGSLAFAAFNLYQFITL